MPSDTKTALLDAAEQAARRKGFDGFSYADLAQDVGIRKASIHYHFPTKSDLSVAMVDRYHRDFATACAEIEATAKTAADRLSGLIAHYRAALQEGESLCLCVALSVSKVTLSDDVMTRIAAFRAMVTDWLETTFAAGLSDGSIAHVTTPKVEARAALPLLEGAHLEARALGSVTAFDQAVELLASRAKTDTVVQEN